MSRKKSAPLMVKPSPLPLICGLISLIGGVAVYLYLRKDMISLEEQALAQQWLFISVVSAGMMWIAATHRLWFWHLWRKNYRTAREVDQNSPVPCRHPVKKRKKKFFHLFRRKGRAAIRGIPGRNNLDHPVQHLSSDFYESREEID